MPKPEKVKVNVKERVEDNVCDLSLSELSEVPVREIVSFKRVTVLDLSSNRLATLGKNFALLTRLTKLDLSKNQLKFLPEDFGMLCNLRHLDLYDNKLEHLPLSLGNLSALRYLDLKGNPLMPALAKIVGHCLTTKDCMNSARNTVKFLAHMQLEAEKAKQKFQLENVEATLPNDTAENKKLALEQEAQQKNNNKKANKKTKSRSKKPTNQNVFEVTQTKLDTNKTSKTNKKSSNSKTGKTKSNSSTALTSILLFFLLLAINILLIYLITFKNPEIAEKIVEFIPPQYRDWILTKAEFFRLRVSDWIQEFRTPPEEN